MVDAMRAKSADVIPPHSFSNKKQPTSAGDISDLPVSPPLKNLRWDRPKREKNHAAKSVEGVYEKSMSSDEENDEEDDKELGKNENEQTPHQNGTEDLNNNKDTYVSLTISAFIAFISYFLLTFFKSFCHLIPLSFSCFVLFFSCDFVFSVFCSVWLLFHPLLIFCSSFPFCTYSFLAFQYSFLTSIPLY